jgi:hypothetical protein
MPQRDDKGGINTALSVRSSWQRSNQSYQLLLQGNSRSVYPVVSEVLNLHNMLELLILLGISCTTQWLRLKVAPVDAPRNGHELIET